MTDMHNWLMDTCLDYIEQGNLDKAITYAKQAYERATGEKKRLDAQAILDLIEDAKKG